MSTANTTTFSAGDIVWWADIDNRTPGLLRIRQVKIDSFLTKENKVLITTEEASFSVSHDMLFRDYRVSTMAIPTPTQTATKTIAIQIGNSDDKLTQKQWSKFCEHLVANCEDWGDIHFAGGSPTTTQWQNFCVVVECSTHNVTKLHSDVVQLRRENNQQSVAWLEGETVFI